MARAWGEHKNMMTPARSEGATHSAGSASGMSARLIGVSMMEGSTQLTLMD